jgi:glycosyltransferase involved in cell wall biosynthesis
MVVQNLGFPADPRVTGFAQTLVGAGFKVEVLAPGRPDQQSDETVDGVQVHRFAPPSDGAGAFGYGREVATSLFRIAKARRRLGERSAPYILHFCNPPDVLWLPFLTPPRASVVIYDQHDLMPELYSAKGGRPGAILHRALLAMERFAYQRADLVLATNASYARVAASRGGLAPERVHVVRNAPRPDLWFPVPPRADLRDNADVVLCYVGSIGLQDGVEDLIRAVAWLRGQKSPRRYRCLIAGAGAAKRGVEDLAARLGVSEDVHFLGWVAGAERLREVVASADIAVEPCHSNPFNDASTMVKVMDYLAMGKPIVAYDLPEHRVTAGEAGVFVSPKGGAEGLGDAIQRLAGDPERRKALGTAALARLPSAGLTYADTQRALLAAYRHACDIGRAKGLDW